MFDDFSLVQRLDVIRALCAGKKVLHLGCVNSPYTNESMEAATLLHADLGRIAGELWGLDSDIDGIEILNSLGWSNIVHGDLENLNDVDLPNDFEVIIAGEVIEHLSNPGLFLDGIRRFMNPQTLLVITTVNAYCAMRFFWYAARGKGGRVEFVHPDHVAYYSFSTLRVLIERSGLSIEQFLFYDVGNEHRPHNRWFLNLLNDISVYFARNCADGLVAICRLRNEEK